MGSERLRLKDVRDVTRVVGECCELGADPKLWRLHLCRRLCELVGAQIGISAESFLLPDGTPQPIDCVDVGWSGEVERSAFLRWVREKGFRSDPVAAAMRFGRTAAGTMTRERRQLLADREWYISEHYNEYRKPAGADHCAVSFTPPSPRHGLLSLAIHRNPGEGCFTRRERLVIHLCNQDTSRLVRTILAGFGQQSIMDLSPRQRQTVDLLLAGLSEKEVAGQLGLRPATVHEYVEAIYRRFGIGSRGELHARLVPGAVLRRLGV